MPRTDDLYELPKDLPVPVDDGACNHLAGTRLPSIPLMSTSDYIVNLSTLDGRTVIYCYPRTGRPDTDPPKGWNSIPSTRGCTPQSRAFRDNFKEFQKVNTRVFGLSTQDTEYQKEAVQRLQLPFDLLSDSELAFAKALKLPTFEVESMKLIKRLTMVMSNGDIEKVFYPVFPPDKNGEEVLKWLKQEGSSDKKNN